jgi:hypothetical protein
MSERNDMAIELVTATGTLTPAFWRIVEGWMACRVTEYVDDCGELECTRLAEEAADAFEVWNELDDEQSPIWDLPIKVGTQQGLLS